MAESAANALRFGRRVRPDTAGESVSSIVPGRSSEQHPQRAVFQVRPPKAIATLLRPRTSALRETVGSMAQSKLAQSNAFAQQPLDLGFMRAGILMPDALAGDVAGKFVQSQRDGQPLLAGHAPVKFDLLLECSLGVHVFSPEQGSRRGGTGRANRREN
jgi:hypothetical protein